MLGIWKITIFIHYLFKSLTVGRRFPIYYINIIKQIDSKLLCVFSVVDHKGRQNVVRTSVLLNLSIYLTNFYLTIYLSLYLSIYTYITLAIKVRRLLQVTLARGKLFPTFLACKWRSQEGLLRSIKGRRIDILIFLRW